MTVQPKDARLVPLSRLASAGSGARQGLLHPGAGQGVALHDLLDVFLFLTLQDAQEVIQLRHSEGMPLSGRRKEEMMETCHWGQTYFSYSVCTYIDFSRFILFQNETQDFLIGPSIQPQTEGQLAIRQLSDVNWKKQKELLIQNQKNLTQTSSGGSNTLVVAFTALKQSKLGGVVDHSELL